MPADAVASAVTLVQGDDASLVAQGARAVVQALLDGRDGGLVVEEFGGPAVEEFDVGQVIDSLMTPAFLVDRRIVVIRDAGKLATADAKRLAEVLDALPPTSFLVLVAGGGTIPASLVTSVKAKGSVVATSAGTGRQRTDWIGERLRAAGVRLDHEAATLLGDHLGEDVGRLDEIVIRDDLQRVRSRNRPSRFLSALKRRGKHRRQITIGQILGRTIGHLAPEVAEVVVLQSAVQHALGIVNLTVAQQVHRCSIAHFVDVLSVTSSRCSGGTSPGTTTSTAGPPREFPSIEGGQPQLLTMLGQRLDQREHVRRFRQHVNAQPVFFSRLRRLRSDTGNDGGVMGLARNTDQVAHRTRGGEEHGVKAATLDRFAGLGGRRRCPHGAVRRDVVDLPAQFGEPGDQTLGGDIGTRQEDPIDGVQYVVELGEFIHQRRRRLLR